MTTSKLDAKEERAYRKLLEEFLDHRERVHHTQDLNCMIVCAACGFYEHRLVLLTEDPEDGHNF